MTDAQLQNRQHRLLDQLDRQGLDALLLNAGPSLTYLTALHVHLSERPVVAVFRSDGPPALILPDLEADKLESLAFEARFFTYGEDPTTWKSSFRRAADETRLDYRRVGIEPQRFRVLELRLIEEAAPSAAYLDAGAALGPLRARKDEGEIDRMREAVRIAEDALRDLLPDIRPGITEKQVASKLSAELLARGSAPELPFSPIAAFGEASANPHAVPSDRELAEGDLILIDWGANVEGYFSDLTRMFSYGEPSGEAREIVDVVCSASQAARSAAGPGVAAADVDRAARSVIEAAGFGPRFVHRTGHGLGLDVHESPYIRAGSDLVLEPGMTFTIEPGIYLPGTAGARIEDDVVVTEDGIETLSTLDRSLANVARADLARPK